MVKLGLLQFSQVESRKSKGLIKCKERMSTVLCEDIQPGTTNWWQPPGISHHHHSCSSRDTAACRERDSSKSRQPSRDWCPRLGSKTSVPATTKGCYTNMPWALSHDMLFCRANDSFPRPGRISSLEPNPTEL